VLRHIVMWKLKESAEGATRAENIVKLKAALETFEVGVAQPGYEATYDVVLVSDFDNQEALQAYQVHPKHLAIKDFVAAVRESRQCIDYEV
jgi:Stress responsive A/B Barrel Domain